MSANTLGIHAPITEPCVNGSGSADPRLALLDATPRLRKNVGVRSQTNRGETWWILENKETGASYRLDAAGLDVLRQLDGVTTVSNALSNLSIEDENAQQHAVGLVMQLQQADLLVHQSGSMNPVEDSATEVKPSGEWLAHFKNPLGIRIPIWDPDRFLTAITPTLRKWLNPFVKSGLILLVIVGLITAFQQLTALSNYGVARAGELSSLVLLLATYPLIKAVHELAHAYCIKKHGGEVHELGVMLLVFFPVPYVDAGASAAFEDKRHRIAVASAGIMAELLLASIAVLVWANVQHGIVSDIAFSIALIGGLSTLLFNGNPLLRFDGYFVLADFLEMPNLAARARSYCFYLCRRFLLGVEGLITPVTAAGEPFWFISYFFASSAYRLTIMLGITIYLIQLLPMFGLLLALLVVARQIVFPAARCVKYLLNDVELHPHRSRAIASTGLVISSVLAGLIVVPAPNWTTLPGVVGLPESGIVRAAGAGFVRELVAANGTQISAGDTIAILENADLIKEAKRLNWRINELEARRAKVVLKSPSEAAQHAESIKATQLELTDINRRIKANVIVAPTSGQLQYIGGNDWLGRHLEEGTTLAHIVSSDARKIVTVAPESKISEIRHPDVTAQVRASATPGTTLAAQIIAVTPAGSRSLSDAALGSKYGGAIAVDSRDETGKLALQQTFRIELATPEGEKLRPGSTVHIRFDLLPSSIGAQIHAAFTRLLMKEVKWY